MNRHFQDTHYYLKRAGETAKQGVAAELGPIVDRYREFRGEDEEPEPGRFERIRADLWEVRTNARSEAREAIAEARGKLAETRQSGTN